MRFGVEFLGGNFSATLHCNSTMIQINPGRLWQSLMDLAKIGATEKGGVRRLTLTDMDRRVATSS